MSFYFVDKKVAAKNIQISDSRSKSSSFAQQIISSIKTVVSFNGQTRAIEKYGNLLKLAETLSVKLGNYY